MSEVNGADSTELRGNNWEKTGREHWVDYIKIFACILVATGHFFMGIVEAGILADSRLYNRLITTIYYFHVPLFFLCSGYLYQKKSQVVNLSSWAENILKKAIVLGVPYFCFSIVTWILKTAFSGYVNNQSDTLIVTLFIKPASPYWYLYTLFFIFLITPVFPGKKTALAGLIISVVLKYIRAGDSFYVAAYAVTKTIENLVWFVSGMCLCVFRIPEICRSKFRKTAGMICTGLFLLFCSLYPGDIFSSTSISVIMGALGCASVFLMVVNWKPAEWLQSVLHTISEYTMPVYLMHTIFAAGIRTVLGKFGIENVAVHIIIGLTASFIGPVIATEMMKIMKLDFLVYPGKYIHKAKMKETHHV